MLRSKKLKGFTLLELIVAMSVLAALAGLAYFGVGAHIRNVQRSAADADLHSIANATKLYGLRYNSYPPDAERNVPSEIKEFIDSQDLIDNWPNAPWPGSVFDYEHWTVNGQQTLQISIRFCPSGTSPLSDCKFPQEPWAANFTPKSAYYYCIKGNCRSHNDEPATYPGYCINCPEHKAIGA